MSIMLNISKLVTAIADEETIYMHTYTHLSLSKTHIHLTFLNSLSLSLASTHHTP